MNQNRENPSIINNMEITFVVELIIKQKYIYQSTNKWIIN
ncbi:MAG: hypothetical protein RLZZ540_2771 [Bacteroidota bacterium]|jgi:hypothetical protein